MLIAFSIENWMSFKEKTNFSMVASKERQHSERLPKISKFGMRVLPFAVIYGGNASGKSNLLKAISFARNLIVGGTQPGSSIRVDPFKLDDKYSRLPTSIEFEILVDGMMYEYSFAVTSKEVLQEKLVRIKSSSEEVLYNRDRGIMKEWGRSLKRQDQFLDFVFKGTRDNQLFLTNSVNQNAKEFAPVYDWFKKSLVLITPETKFDPFQSFFDEREPLFSKMNELLQQLDTGIMRLSGEEIPLESVPLPKELRMRLEEDVKEGTYANITSKDERFTLSRKEGEIIVKKLVTFHKKVDGSEIKFDIGQESDGTQRVMDLLPAFLDISNQETRKVYLVDEFDRSIHTLLTRQLIEAYLEGCSCDGRSQLILTTHDVLLMDQKLLRRDEMWVTERDREGASNLTSFSEFEDVRYDKDIRKSYLLGRLGGIPRLLVKDLFSPSCGSIDLNGNLHE